MSVKYLNDTQIIFWDFDGVIKDSVEVKSVAFGQLFSSFGRGIKKKIINHHKMNGGMSRFDKLPIYIKWTEQKSTQEMVDDYSAKFSTLVRQKVIDSQWVPGVLNYLSSNHNKQKFFLVTATPQQEIEDILVSLKIKHFFKEVVGSPTTKVNAIKGILNKHSILSKNSIMIGDSISDCNAANINNVQFVLRKTVLNKKLQKSLNCLMLENFL